VATFVSPIKKSLSRFFNMRFNRWLKRRIPPASQHKLSNRNIFIMPSRFGFAYITFVILLFLLATNYQNNIIMLLSYLMASIFITTMMQSFFNLSGIEISAEKEASGYAKTNIYFTVKILSPNKRLDLHFSFDDQQALHLSQCTKGEKTAYVLCHYENRGVYYPGRLKVWSEYSLGLFITWTKIDFGNQCSVYPQVLPLKESQRKFSGELKENSAVTNDKQGIDDFFELKTHIPGESLSRIAWKQLARGQGRLTKHYHEQQGAGCWLKITDMPNNSIEIKLQHLCFLVNEYNTLGQAFGLDLGQNKIMPSQGEQHFKQCLMALAIYPK